jgi:hypothetical protein
LVCTGAAWNFTFTGRIANVNNSPTVNSPHMTYMVIE